MPRTLQPVSLVATRAMEKPSLKFLCKSIATGLLEHYKIDRPPVQVRKILLQPPPDLAGDISLTENHHISFCDALWIRLQKGQGVIFANSTIPEPHLRYAMAGALFTGLCSSKGGRAIGLPAVPNDHLTAQSALFSREMLVPATMLPTGWAEMPAQKLAELFSVPEWVMKIRLQELTDAL